MTRPLHAYLGSGILIMVLVLGALQPANGQMFVRGDANFDTQVSIADVAFLIRYLYLNGEPPVCFDSCDADDDGAVMLNDALVLISLLFTPGGWEGLMSPYPAAGTDPTAVGLPPCQGFLLDPPAGSNIQHIFFVREDRGVPGIAGYPGQEGLSLPIFLETAFPLEGYTLSLYRKIEQVPRATIHFAGSVATEYGADFKIPHESEVHPGFNYAYVVMEFVPPYTDTKIPAGDELLLGTLVIDLSEDLVPGDTVLIAFEPKPPGDEEPFLRNEMVITDFRSSFPERHHLELPIVAPNELFIRGDTNRNGHLDLGDGFHILDYLFSGSAPNADCEDALDVNDDGALNLADAIQLLQFIFSDGVPPAAPFPYLGIDPTSDDPLACD